MICFPYSDILRILKFICKYINLIIKANLARLVAHTFKPNAPEQKQANIYKFKVRLA